MKTNTIEQALESALEHHRAGRLAEAETLYRQVLSQVPGHVETVHLLGILAGQRGAIPEAIQWVGRAIALDPDVAEYHNSLGELYRRARQPEAAMLQFRRAIELKPDLALAHGNLGSALHAAGRLDEAVAEYDRAIELEPHDFKVQSNLGVALQETNRTDLAILAYRRALALKPDYVVAQRNLGVALHRAGRTEEAVAACHLAIALGGDDAVAYSNLGMALQDAGECDQAIAALQRAIALDPRYVESYNNLGNALRTQGRLDEAIAAYRRAIAIEPGYAYAYNNLGGVYKEQGRLDLGLACLRRAVELKPDFAQAASNRLFDLHFHPDHDAQAILAEHRQWAVRYAAPLANPTPLHPRGDAPDRRLRIGFVSPDFRGHPVGQLLLQLFTHHDRGHSEFVAYSDVRQPDGLTDKLKAQADVWHGTIGLSDEHLAERIQADRIDVLVDLSLHTANNRMLVFARKPAPVQVTMLGLPSTTGLATMDYRLTDPYLDPPGETDDAYVERSIRLPHCFWCYQPAQEIPPGDELPAAKNGYFKFGCLNQFPKVTRPALQLWVKILQALGGSRLLLHAPMGGHREEVKALFQQGGVAPDRVEFVAKAPLSDYLRRYHTLDLALDPFPFSGGTTTLDALWMGVPVVTLAGRTAVGRGGASILTNLGLTELIARTPEQYLAIALEMATDPVRLAALHAGLRQRMLASPLMDGKQYAADVEEALRGMWKSWCLKPGVAEYHCSLGESFRRAGHWDGAIASFGRVTELNPEHGEAYNRLGQVLWGRGRLDEAIVAFRRAVELQPTQAAPRNNLGAALHSQGHVDEAIAAFRGAIQLSPELAELHNNLGNALWARGRFEEAMAACRRAIARKPEYAEAHNNLSNALRELGRPEDALAASARAIALRPDYAEAHSNLGLTLRALGRLDDALAAYARAIALRPDYAEAHCNLGTVLHQQGRLDEAIAAFTRALQIKPGLAEAHSNLGNTLGALGRLDEAIAALSRAIEHDPGLAAAHSNLGNVFCARGRLDEAIAACERAIELQPGLAMAHINLGLALGARGRLDDAKAALYRAIELEPESAVAHNNLGAVLKDQGSLDEALACFRRAAALNPADSGAVSNALSTLYFHPDYDARAILDEHRRWEAAFAAPLAGAILPLALDRSPERRLRIGYVSPDFRAHPVGRFVLPLLESHDHGSFEIFAYDTSSRPDAITERCRAQVDGWRDVAPLSDDQVAGVIRGDRIDILVDLAMHLAHGRLLVFARKPAPIQVTYLAYCGTTGLSTMDYRLTDPHLDRPQDEDCYSEETIRLPETYWCYQPAMVTASTTPLPALQAGHLTFGCLNNFGKITAPCLEAWSRLLQVIPEARLLLHAQEGGHRDRVWDYLEERGVGRDRLTFVGRSTIEEYLRLYERIDVGLDPFPYGGGTTTCDALWMGVPVVSLAGQTAVGRGGLSILSNLGLPELVGHDVSEYVSIALGLAQDRSRLRALRSTLRSRMQSSPLMDPQRFARGVEAAYRTMWQRWCARV